VPFDTNGIEWWRKRTWACKSWKSRGRPREGKYSVIVGEFMVWGRLSSLPYEYPESVAVSSAADNRMVTEEGFFVFSLSGSVKAYQVLQALLEPSPGVPGRRQFT
jgi:hypothetical protein